MDSRQFVMADRLALIGSKRPADLRTVRRLVSPGRLPAGRGSLGILLRRQDAAGGARFDEEGIRVGRAAGAHGRSACLRIDDCSVAGTAMVMRAADAEARPQGRGWIVVRHRGASEQPPNERRAVFGAELSIRGRVHGTRTIRGHCSLTEKTWAWRRSNSIPLRMARNGEIPQLSGAARRRSRHACSPTGKWGG